MEKHIENLVNSDLLCVLCSDNCCDTCSGFLFKEDFKEVEGDYLKIVKIADGIYPEIGRFVLYEKACGCMVPFLTKDKDGRVACFIFPMFCGLACPQAHIVAQIQKETLALENKKRDKEFSNADFCFEVADNDVKAIKVVPEISVCIYYKGKYYRNW